MCTYSQSFVSAGDDRAFELSPHDLAGGVARPEDRALAESVREAEGIAAPGMEVGREVARGDGAAQDDVPTSRTAATGGNSRLDLHV